MVNALIEIDDKTNHVLNMVKAKYSLRDKAEAIRLVVSFYADKQEEPQFRPEFIKRIEKARKGKFIKMDDLRQRYGLT